MYPKGQMNLRSSGQNERTGEGTVGKREEERERRKEGKQETREDKEAGWHLSQALKQVRRWGWGQAARRKSYLSILRPMGWVPISQVRAGMEDMFLGEQREQMSRLWMGKRQKGREVTARLGWTSLVLEPAPGLTEEAATGQTGSSSGRKKGLDGKGATPDTSREVPELEILHLKGC